MALVMKQQNRPEEAIEAIKSFRHSCSKPAQESLDNVLIDLYKKCGMLEEQIAVLKKKLRMIYTGEAFNGRTSKTARSHGKKFQVSIAQETSRVLVRHFIRLRLFERFLSIANLKKKNVIVCTFVWGYAWFSECHIPFPIINPHV
ncbi:hypothetical protein KSP39_PZI012256 [Platanthera zijinensis]|uniref:Uncharacterized protein n=1 Tax=Platanthera zijinensis TaxID=2320716 RepID=A0AAP0BFU2_9ASPA